jgi:predicted PurR-regulated permease PerM
VLGWWLIGRGISMAATGILTGLGLWLLGIPLALTLALLAAVLTFVPYVGAILSAIPALLLGLVHSPTMVLYVAILYVVRSAGCRLSSRHAASSWPTLRRRSTIWGHMAAITRN